MINKFDLQIGSLMYALTCGESKEYQMCKVLELLDNYCHWTSDLNQVGIANGYSSTIYDYCYPIKITPSVLSMCGFLEDESEEEVNGYKKYGSNALFHFDIFLNRENNCCVHYLNAAFLYHPQNLHELQMAILVLTGQEMYLIN